MRSDLTRNPSDPRFAECGNGEPRCHLAPAPGDNPLRLCDGHLSEHRARCGISEPAPCPACNPCAVWAHRRYITIVGALCFACDRTNGGTVPSEAHRREAAGLMRARLLVLWREGDRGPEWDALMARCPPQIREAFEARLQIIPPTETSD